MPTDTATTVVVTPSREAGRPPTPPPAPVRQRRARAAGRDRVQVAVLAAPVVMAFAGAWTHRYNSEDAFINFRIVDQMLAGNGPVFNAGERVEAYTSPLWLAVLALARAATGQVVSLPVLSVGLGLVLSTAAVGLAVAGAWGWPSGAAGAPAARRWWIPVGALAVAATPAFGGTPPAGWSPG